jgi:hypothetical protein
VLLNPGHAGPQRVAHLGEVVGTQVGKLLPLDVPPHEFGGVEVGGVTGQPFHGEPRPLPHEVRRHLPTLVRGQAIPDEGEVLPGKVAVEILQERNKGVGVVTAGTGLEEQATPLAVPPEREGDTDRQLRPVVGMDQDGGLAAGRPRAPDRRALGDSALVLKDDPGPAAPSVFFTAGQRVDRQWRIAASLRSLAWRAGRCSVHSSVPNTRHTCAG